MEITRRNLAAAGALAFGMLRDAPALAEAAEEASVDKAVEALRKALTEKDKTRLEQLAVRAAVGLRSPAGLAGLVRSLRRATYPQLLHHSVGHDRSAVGLQPTGLTRGGHAGKAVELTSGGLRRVPKSGLSVSPGA